MVEIFFFVNPNLHFLQPLSFFPFNPIPLFIYIAWFYRWVYSTYRQTPIFFSLQSYSTFCSACMISSSEIYSTYCQTPIFFSLQSYSTFRSSCMISSSEIYSTYRQIPIFFSLHSYSTFHSFCMILSLSLFYLSSNTHLFFSPIQFYFSYILHDFIVESILLIIKLPSFFLYNPILLFVHFV